MNGKAKLDMEKQALKRACRHHKTKSESLKLQNEEIILDLNRTQNELEAWRERTRRNHDEVDENIATLKQSERGNFNIKYSVRVSVASILLFTYNYMCNCIKNKKNKHARDTAAKFYSDLK